MVFARVERRCALTLVSPGRAAASSLTCAEHLPRQLLRELGVLTQKRLNPLAWGGDVR